MKSHLIAGAIVLSAALTGVASANELAKGSNNILIIRAEKGDTFANLFGQDWQKAYQENKMTVIRRRKPVTSPDILIEGCLIRVSSGMHLTQRALSRIDAFTKRRNDARAKLANLKPDISALPGAQGVAAACHRILDTDLLSATELDFVDSVVGVLERSAADPKPGQTSQPAPTQRTWPLVFALVGFALAGAILWRRNRPEYPEGEVRYRETLQAVQAALNSTRQYL